MLKKLKYYIFAVDLFAPNVFSGINGILGKLYTGSEGDNRYIIFCLFFTVASIIIILYDFIHKSIKLSSLELLFLFSPIIFILLFYIESPQSLQAFKMFQQYIIWGVPAIVIGIYLEKSKQLHLMTEPMIFFCLLMLIGLVRTWIFGLAKALIENETAGESYQAASYTSALCYSVFLYVCLFRNLVPQIISRYRLLWMTLMLLCVIIIFLTGGRGGMVMVLIATAVFVYYYQKNNNISFKSKVIIATCIVLGIISIIVIIHSNPILNETSQRVFSYISEDGIDMSKTSHRDEAYLKAWKNISLSPVYGHGIFKYFDINGNYPHNIFLEILLQGGWIFLFLFVVFFFLYFRKLSIILKTSEENTFFLIFLLSPLVSLIFSGSYISTGLFWFCLSYVSNYRLTLRNTI